MEALVSIYIIGVIVIVVLVVLVGTLGDRFSSWLVGESRKAPTRRKVRKCSWPEEESDPKPVRVFTGVVEVFNAIPEELRVTYNAARSETQSDKALDWLAENVLGQEFHGQVTQDNNGVWFDEELNAYTMLFATPLSYQSKPCLLEETYLHLIVPVEQQEVLAALEDGDLLEVTGTMSNAMYNGRQFIVTITCNTVTVTKPEGSR
jgi:hypothetical protein